MKKCLQCEQVYGDETNFCLSDGAALVAVPGSFASPGEETPTVFSGAPPTNFPAAPFVPPGAPASSSAPATRGKTLLIAVAVGIFALAAGGAVVGLLMYGLYSGGKNDSGGGVSNTNDKSDRNASDAPRPADENAVQKLKEEQEKLDRERRKLDDERRRLEAQKKTPTPAPTVSDGASTAAVIDPPSNIRSAPNGTVLCIARTRGTIVNILGSTGVTDNNGTWYYTDYCGRRGVIHSTQIRF